jgi:hypothetical protein
VGRRSSAPTPTHPAVAGASLSGRPAPGSMEGDLWADMHSETAPGWERSQTADQASHRRTEAEGPAVGDPEQFGADVADPGRFHSAEARIAQALETKWG